MKKKEKKFTEDDFPDFQPVDFITFKELVDEVTGGNFNKIYENMINEGSLDEQSNMV